MSDQWSDGQEKYINMELRPTTTMGACFSIQIRLGVKKFWLQTPWSQNWCLVPELVLARSYYRSSFENVAESGHVSITNFLYCQCGCQTIQSNYFTATNHYESF
jgi:hypothetical protein